jgi:hypothetical protein
MTADRISFVLTKNVSISIGSDGHVMLLDGDDCNYIQNTNFGRFLVASCRLLGPGVGPQPQCSAQQSTPPWPTAASGSLQ